MELTLNEKSQQLFELLMQLPPDFAAAEALLKRGDFSPEEVTKVAKAPEPELQLYHMLMMLLDYMIADPRLPDPTTFD